MEQVLDQLITVGAGLGILAGAWFIWFLSGVVNNMFTNVRWSWRRMFEDIVKTLVMGIGILSWVVLMNVLDWYTQKLGMDISSVLDGATVVGLLAVIVGGSANYAMKAYRNFIEFIGTSHVAKISGEQDYSGVADDIKNVVTELFTPKEAVDAHKQFEEEGGRGQAYRVNISTYDAFRNDVMGKGYDIDGSWGWQCWDGCALFWQQLGLRLLTGNGCAYGCWTLNRDTNAVDQFTVITDKTQILRGDVLVFRTGEFGHIGFADEDYRGGNSIRLLGQNQGGVAGPNGGAAFNVINMSMATFLGAFRYKGWSSGYSKATIKPSTEVEASTIKSAGKNLDTTPKQPNSAKNSQKTPVLGEIETFTSGDKVNVLRYIDVNGTNLLRLQNTPYLVIKVNKTKRQALLQSDDGDIYAWMAFGDISKAN